MKTKDEYKPMSRPGRVVVGVAFLSAGLGLAACQPEGTAEKAGQKIDQAAEKAGKKLEGASQSLP